MTAALRAGGIELAEGVSLRAAGRLEVYPERGTVELRVSHLNPSVGIGDHALARRDARYALRRDGLLDAQAALRLSAPPLRVGVWDTWGRQLGQPAGRPGRLCVGLSACSREQRRQVLGCCVERRGASRSGAGHERAAGAYP